MYGAFAKTDEIGHIHVDNTHRELTSCNAHDVLVRRSPLCRRRNRRKSPTPSSLCRLRPAPFYLDICIIVRSHALTRVDTRYDRYQICV